MEEMRGTTICAVKKNGQTAIAGDGQVTLSQSVIFKNNAVKVRRIYNDKVIFGFAGSVADAFSLSERFEEMLNKFSGNLMRSAVELAEQWRKGMANKLEAMMITAGGRRLRHRERRQLRPRRGARARSGDRLHRGGDRKKGA